MKKKKEKKSERKGKRKKRKNGTKEKRSQHIAGRLLLLLWLFGTVDDDVFFLSRTACFVSFS